MKVKYHRSYYKGSKKYKGLDWLLTKRLIAYLLPYKTFLFIAIALLVVSKGIEAFLPIYIGHLVQVVLGSSFRESLSSSITLSYITTHCFFIILLLFFAYILDSINVILKNWIGQKGLLELRTQVYEHIQKLPIDFFNKTPVGTLMTRTIHDVDQINQMFSESIVPLMGSLVLFICISIGLIIIDWRAAIVLFCILPIVFCLTNFFRHNQRRCYDLIRGIVSSLNAFVQEHLMGASTIRSFGLQEDEIRQFNEINEDHRNANVETIHYFAFFFAGIDFLQSLALICIFVVLAVETGQSTPFEAGTYFTFSLYVLMLFRPLADLAERYNLLQSAIAAADRIFQILDEKPEGLDEKSKHSIQEIDTIEFQDVWFAYRKDNWILKGLTFSIQKGESIALVGVTGAGKTTIMNLLLRFNDIQKGEIKINGKNIQEYPLNLLRKQFSVVLQDPEIFSGTIRDNISLGQKTITKERVDSVVNYVNLRSFVDTLSKGIDHYLSERGKSISAGQRQLVSMARAVAHDRSVLILDEATANIDSGTEKIIQDVLGKILHDKTSIVIAHRLSTIKDVDKIVVLHEGAVKELGTHSELLKHKGIYEKLYRLQFMDK